MRECESNGVVNFSPVKTLLTGLPGVGKTSFLYRLQKKNIKAAWSQGSKSTLPSTGFQRPVTVNIREETTTINTIAISKGRWETTSSIVDQGHVLLQSVNRPSQFSEISSHLQLSDTPDSSRKPTVILSPPPPQSTPTTSQSTPTKSFLNRVLKSAPKGFRSKSEKLTPTRKFMSEVLSSSEMQELEDLEEMTTVYFMDTGGQPEFHELLPPLLRGPTLHLIFFNASHDLTLPVEVSFRHKDGETSLTYETSSNSIEIVHQLLSSHYCLSQENNIQNSVSVLLGSHIDLLSTDKTVRSKQIQEVSELLLKQISNTSFYEDGFITFPTSKGVDYDPIFLPLDNATASEEEMEDIQTFLLKVMKDRFPPVPLPLTWAAFHLILRHGYEQSPGVCTLAECTDLAVSCGIRSDDVITVLNYFHDKLGTILYYEEVESLKEYVICNPDVLFSGISRLVTVSFAGSGDKHTAADKIRKTGVIPPHILQTATPLTPKCPLNNQHLIDLLTHLKLITHLGDDAKPSVFMPCLLKPDNTVLLSHTSQNVAAISPPPLLVLFKGAFIPIGVFSGVMVELSKRWRLDYENRHRNRATFIGGLFNVEIRSCIGFIEVRLTGSCDIAQFCSSVRKDIVECVNAVLRVQPHVSHLDCLIGFYCPSCFLPSNPANLHPCECVYSVDDVFTEALLCKNNPRCEGFNDPFPISPEFKVWFEVRSYLHLQYNLKI